MRTALSRHDALIERIVRDHGGRVVRPRGEGDSRFAVFFRPDAAVVAAGAIQLALRKEMWPTSSPLKIRVALNTGAADFRDGDYYGNSVNRCARLRGLCRPGQVLVSGVTAALASAALPPEYSLRSLGTRRLKDLAQPELVHELVLTERPRCEQGRTSTSGGNA